MVTRLCLYLGYTLPSCPFNAQPEGCPQPRPRVGTLRTAGPHHSQALALPWAQTLAETAEKSWPGLAGRASSAESPASLPRSEGVLPPAEESQRARPPSPRACGGYLAWWDAGVPSPKQGLCLPIAPQGLGRMV